MDPDTSLTADKPPVINYILSFLLVGVAWGFTTPFIRRAAADFNARQDAKRDSSGSASGQGGGGEEDEGQELLGEDQGDSDDDDKSEDSNRPPPETRTTQSQPQPQPQPAWRNQTRRSWLKTRLAALLWTIVNLLRTPAYSVPLVINLTGSVWFFLLVGKHGRVAALVAVSAVAADMTRTLPYRPPCQLERVPVHGAWGVVCRAEGDR